MAETNKGKPVFFSMGVHSKIHTLSEVPEVDGFKQKQLHEEKVQHMLEKAVNMAILDVKRNPPKRSLS